MTLYKFYAEWCQPCKTLSQIMKSVDVHYINVDVEDDDEPVIDTYTGRGLAMLYNVRSVPTLVLASDDMTEAAKMSGLRTKAEIQEWLAKHSE